MNGAWFLCIILVYSYLAHGGVKHLKRPPKKSPQVTFLRLLWEFSVLRIETRTECTVKLQNLLINTHGFTDRSDQPRIWERSALSAPSSVTGWVGIVWSRENVLMNTWFPSDHLESLLFLRDYY